MKTLIIIAIVIGIIVIAFVGSSLLHKKEFDCNNWGAIYLLPNETGLASGIASRGNLAVIISANSNETNSLIVPVGLPQCSNFHYAEFLGGNF